MLLFTSAKAITQCLSVSGLPQNCRWQLSPVHCWWSSASPVSA